MAIRVNTIDFTLIHFVCLLISLNFWAFTHFVLEINKLQLTTMKEEEESGKEKQISKLQLHSLAKDNNNNNNNYE